MADRLISSMHEEHLLSLMLLGGRAALHNMRSEWSRRRAEQTPEKRASSAPSGDPPVADSLKADVAMV